jgi:hypothetical protein
MTNCDGGFRGSLAIAAAAPPADQRIGGAY